MIGARLSGQGGGGGGAVTDFFGTGEAGDLVFDGSTTVNVPDASGVTTAMAPSAGAQSAVDAGGYQQYIMTFDIFANNLTIDPGVWLYTGGYRVFVAGTLTIGAGGGIGFWGGDGATGAAGSILGGAGGAARAATLLGGSTIGGAGANGGGGGAGGAGGAHVSGAKGMTAGGATGTGGTCQGGAGGAAAGGGTGAGGSITLLNDNVGNNLSSPWNAIHGRSVTGVQFFGGTGGGGGRGGATGGNGSGAGGGGSGGGVCVVAANTIVGTGILNCRGGKGGNAGPLVGNNSGAGSGGGGGVILCFIGTGDFPTCSAAGGVHGTAGAANVTANKDGFDGGPGLIYLFRLGAE